MQDIAPTLGVHLRPVGVQSVSEFENVFATIAKERPDGLIVQPDTFFVFHRRRIVDFAAQTRLPAVFTLREFADAGGLTVYGVDYHALFRRTATYVDKVLKGANPADLPVEQAMTFGLVINLKTARALGLAIPPSLLLRADRIIE